MLTVAEALAAVLAHARPLPPRKVGLRDALGLRLAEDVHADLDLPPFDKALVDGFALRASDAPAEGPVTLRIVDSIFAGQTPGRPIGPGEAAVIMTGAPLPDGADSVVMVEKTSRPDPDHVTFPGPIVPGQNRLVRGREMRAGEVVVAAGSIVNPPRLGVLASVGRGGGDVPGHVPIVAIAPTGDELVGLGQVPGPGTDPRRERPPRSGRCSVQADADGVLWPTIADRPEALRDAFREALVGGHWRCNILLVSGGVSAGQKDLVPEALVDVGVRPVFHKVRVKPGKPLWFGAGPDRGEEPPPLVFGLPGNPVSGLVSFLLFVRPALDILAGRVVVDPAPTLPLASSYPHDDDRDCYRPARIVEGARVEPLDWSGSSDLRGAAVADGFAIFPAGERMYEEGEPIGFLPMDTCRIGPRSPY